MKGRRISLSRHGSLGARGSRDNVPLYVEPVETTPLIPGSDAWARRRELNRRSKIIGIALSLGFLVVVATLVAAVLYLLSLFVDERPEPDMDSMSKLENPVARMKEILGAALGANA